MFQGDGFDCGSQDDLILLHSRFSSRNGTSQSCNNGSIEGMSLGVEETATCLNCILRPIMT